MLPKIDPACISQVLFSGQYQRLIVTDPITNLTKIIHLLTTDRLAQLVDYRTTVREVVGSNPSRTTTQGL